MPDPAYTVEGAKEAADALRKAGKDGKRAVRRAGKDIGDFVADRSRARARSGGVRMQIGALKGLRGKGTLKGGAIVIANTARVPYAMAAFLGAKGRRGWYADPRYRGRGGQQFPDWVGNQWQPGGTGGPYHVNDVIRRYQDQLIAIFSDELQQAIEDLGLDFDN